MNLSKRDENNLLKKELIIQSAIQMIEADTLEHFNMKALADISGVPRATLYRHYPGKEELFHDIAVHWGSHFTENLAPSRTNPELDKALNQTFKAILEEAQQRPELFRVVLLDLFQANIDASDFENDFALLFFSLLEKFSTANKHAISSDDLNVLLRLLLANLQLLTTKKISSWDALKNMAYCVSALKL